MSADALLVVVAIVLIIVCWLAIDISSTLAPIREREQRALRESIAADIVLAIEEQNALLNGAGRLSSTQKAARFLEIASRELPELDIDERLQLLRSTLPKLHLGAFADPRRSTEVFS